MKNVIIECYTINHNGDNEVLVFHSDEEMKEFFIYNETYKFVNARKIILLQHWDHSKKAFEWI